MSADEDDVQVKFMEKHGKNYKWPSKTDEAWVSVEDCICEIDEPKLVNNRLQYYVDTSRIPVILHSKTPITFK